MFLEFFQPGLIMFFMNLSAKLFSSRRVVLTVWIAIFLMKLSLGIFHVLAAQRSRIVPLQFGLGSIEYRGSDIESSRAFDEYAKSITRTVDAYQRNSQREHLLIAYGYFAAAFTSLTSILLELRNLLKGNN